MWNGFYTITNINYINKEVSGCKYTCIIAESTVPYNYVTEGTKEMKLGYWPRPLFMTDP